MYDPLLTFKNNSFVLAFSDGYEQKLSMGEAYKYMRISDVKADRMWNRVLVKRYSFDESYLPDFLDPHQREGVAWILSRSRSYLAHAPGAGKTCEAIVASQMAGGEGPVLFVVPPSLTVNWEREIIKWSVRTPTISIVPVTLRRKEMDWNADFIICPDSMVVKPWVFKNLYEVNARFVAVDEASRFKEPTSQRTIALFGGIFNDGTRSPGLVYRARHSVLLDGSPMPNRPMELWAPVFAMSPETIDFQNQHEFGVKYCGATLNDRGQWEYRHASNEHDLRKRLQSSFMHVVNESELNHPERKRSIVFMNKDVRHPEQVRWEKENLGNFNFDDLDEDASQGDMARFRRLLGERKVAWISDYVKDRLKNTHESILLFAWHRPVVIGLSSALKKIPHGVVMGGTSDAEREAYFKDFQTGKIRLLIMNIASAGRGHNLQHADRVIFGEFSWTDETNKQCEKRASRKGSLKTSVRCEYIVCPGSMDEMVLQSVFRKVETNKKVFGDGRQLTARKRAKEMKHVRN